MKTKLVIFDLDGVLVEAKNIHFDALNEALGEQYAISWAEHLSTYDGLKTNQKLEMLSEQKGLPTELHKEIWEGKQKLTLQKLKELQPNQTLQSVMDALVEDGYKIAVCSNSIRKTVLTVLSKLGIMEFMDLIISNEDVKNSKPHPEMYWKAMSMMGVLPEDTTIVEDSPPGLLAAQRSRASYIRVDNPYDVTREKIFKNLKSHKMKPKWKNENLNVLIPMAGAGSRFAKAGYTFPKPLIDVNGKPMIQVVIDNLGVEANFIFVVQKEHNEKYNVEKMLEVMTGNCTVIEVDGLTEGAACTALLARDYIDNDKPLLFANSDQFVEWEPLEFMYEMQERNCDGGIVTFEATHPKWS